MTTHHHEPRSPDEANAQLDKLLGELQQHGEQHRAPAALPARILAVLPEQHATEQSAAQEVTTPIRPQPSHTSPQLPRWFQSPLRALAASAAPLIVGVLLGSSGAAAEWLADQTLLYPETDELLVLANLSDDELNNLPAELDTTTGLSPNE